MSIISSEDLDKRDDDNFKKGWNAAIEQSLIVNAKFNGSTEVDAAIRKLKK